MNKTGVSLKRTQTYLVHSMGLSNHTIRFALAEERFFSYLNLVNERHERQSRAPPTVIMLGAGANRDFRFPLGVELRHEVCALPKPTSEPKYKSTPGRLGTLRTPHQGLLGTAKILWIQISRTVFLEQNPVHSLHS